MSPDANKPAQLMNIPQTIKQGNNKNQFVVGMFRYFLYTGASL